ncbi:MAG: TonB-dependent receptor [Ignavibacteria bacterium]|nr:TonB-dependent receptor [Ignavibacteria bacterium]
MTPKKTLITAFLLICNIAFSQNGKISGTVTSSEDGLPVVSAVILIENLSISLQTDIRGEFVFKELTEGNYSLQVFHEGYKTTVTTVAVGKNQTVKLNIKLEKSTITTGEIFVSSVRYESMLKEVPMPMEILSNDDIDFKPYMTISDALETKSGISLNGDGIWSTDVTIRGLSKSNIVTNVDGNRVETSNDLAGRLSMFDVNDIDRIEVIKGGVSSLYGTGAFGGVVNIFTKNGDFSNKFNIGSSIVSGYNSVNNNTLGWLSVFTSSDRFYAKISGGIRAADNTKTPKGELPNSQFKDNNISANLGFRPLMNHELRISWQRYRGENIGVPGGNTLFPTSAVVTYPHQDRDMFSGEYKIKNAAAPLKEVSAKYFYQTIFRDVVNIPNTVQTVKTPSGKIKQKVYVESITPNAHHYTNGLQFKADWILGKYNYLITGVDIWMRELDSRRERNQKIENIDTVTGIVKSTVMKTTGEKPIPESDYRSIGTYVQDEMKFLDEKLKVNIGGRVDQILVTNEKTLQPVYEKINGVINYNPAGQKVIWEKSESDDISWSTNLGTIYSLTKNYDFTFNISRSFRSPSLEERYQYIDLGSSLRVGNPDLSPEKGLFTDLGIRVWRDMFTFTGNVFYNYFQDLVAEVPGTYENRPAYIKTNIGEARLYGYDFEFMYNFYGSFTGYGTLSYVRGEDTENNTNLPQIPPLNARIGIRFSVYDYVNADLNSVLYNEQTNIAAGEVETPGYAVFNFGLSSRNFNMNYYTFQLFAGIENIFDKEYRNHLSTNRGLVTIEPGVNFYFKLKIDF